MAKLSGRKGENAYPKTVKLSGRKGENAFPKTVKLLKSTKNIPKVMVKLLG